jgi:NhaP-type Na+/H+ or K+/H+ antiporter
MQMAAPAPEAAGRLFTVDPDVAKLLEVETLCEDVVGFVSLYLDGNVAEAGKF